jgi:hypothetical protein
MRIPVQHKFAFREGAVTLADTAELNDPNADPKTNWLAPEMVFRSGNVTQWPFIERLPDDEIAKFLADDSPIVYHIFHAYGKQWWEFGPEPMVLDEGVYRYAIEVWPDVYSTVDGKRVWDTNPLSYELKLRYWNENDDWVHPAKGQWGKQWFVFTHHGGLCEVALMCRQRYGVLVGGTFLRRESLERIGDVGAPSPVRPPQPVDGEARVMLAELQALTDKWRGRLEVQG